MGLVWNVINGLPYRYVLATGLSLFLLGGYCGREGEATRRAGWGGHDGAGTMRGWPGLMALIALLGGMYVLFSVARHFRVQHLVTAVPGWEKLSECSPVGSFDGSKTLSFSADRTVALLDMRDRKNRSLAESKGAWTYDDTRDRYTVSLNNETRQYALINPDGSNVCILADGDVTAVNLQQSWFGTTSSDDSDD
jgi:hypothetical protein